MIVLGVPISEEQIAACAAARKGFFTAWHIADAARKAGVTGNYVPERVADRLLQRWRKQGAIRRVRAFWELTP